MKKDILKIKNEINNLTIKLNTCNLELKNCHGPNKRNCDDSKYDALFVKYNSLYSDYLSINYSWTECKTTNANLLIQINQLNQRKCDENCESNLRICNENITMINNIHNINIQYKIDEINKLNVIIANFSKSCGGDYSNLQIRLSTCKSQRIEIKQKYETCNFRLKHEMNLSQTYYLELISLRQQIKICSSQDVCRNDEVVMFRRLAERCEEDKIKIREKSNHLYEKYQKLHNEKHSFFSESNSLLKNISHQCSTDVNSLDQFMSKFEISVTGLTNFQSSIMLDISKDKIEKNKIIENIKLKKDENTRIKNQYTEMQKEIKFIEKNILELIEKLKKTSDKNQIIILVKQIEEEEKRNKDKNSKLISFIERINKTQIDLNVMGNEIKSLNSLINFRNDKHKVIKNIYTNVENSKTDIKKFIDTKKTITEEAFTKIKNYKKTVIAEDPLISILKKEKNDSNDMVKKIENMNKKLEQTIVDLKKKLIFLKFLELKLPI